MNVFFIVDEFPFFLPEYLDRTVTELNNGGISVVGITPLVTPKDHKTLYSYLMGQVYRLGVESVIRLALEYVRLITGKISYVWGFSDIPHTIAQVAHKHNVPVYSTKRVNDPEYIEQLRSLEIDIIVSSCSQIFKEEILRLPKISCINRHSGLLPSYGGLFPVFQAMIHDEQHVGTTVHTMVKKIDGGTILSQFKHAVRSDDTLFGLYKITYDLSVAATVEAIRCLMKKNYRAVHNRYKESYYSFPINEDWNTFWEKGKRVI